MSFLVIWWLIVLAYAFGRDERRERDEWDEKERRWREACKRSQEGQ